MELCNFAMRLYLKGGGGISKTLSIVLLPNLKTNE